MKIIILAAASAVALSSGLAMAQTVPGPKEPIPYSQLSAYMKASPKMRARKDWWSGQPAAQTGAASNTSAVSSAGADVRATPDAAPATTPNATSVNPPSLGGGATAAQASGAVNPSPSAAPGAPASTTPPK